MNTTVQKPLRAPFPITWPRMLILLSLRLILFGVVQGGIIVALVLAARPREESLAWWPLSTIPGNLINLWLLFRWVHAEGGTIREYYLPNYETWKRDLLRALLTLIIATPLASIPSILLGQLLLGDPASGWALLTLPLQLWAIVNTVVAFPVLNALTELPMYYGFLMPRLRMLLSKQRNMLWLTVFTPALFHSIQHVVMPISDDWAFALWRGNMFLFFAIALAVALHRWPRILPYLVVAHLLLNIQVGVGILVTMQ